MILENINELLNTLNPNQKDFQKSTKAMESIAVDHLDIDDFLYWSEADYTRNLIAKTEAYELYVCCWKKGQKSAIHDIAGQQAWCKIIQGSLKLTVFEKGERIYEKRLIKGDLMQPIEKDQMYALNNDEESLTVSLHLVSFPVSYFKVQNKEGNDVELMQKTYNTINGTIINA